MTFSDSDRSKLDWQAFLYVCDELPADAREAFESMLAENQSAREAVARAVEIGQALVHAEALELPQPARSRVDQKLHRVRRLQWMSIGAAASLALVLLVGSALRPLLVVDGGPDSGSASVASLNSELGQLAEIWGARREQIANLQANLDAAGIDGEEGSGDWRSDEVAWVDGEASSEPAHSDLAIDLAGEDSSTVEAPLWMLAALQGLSQTDDPQADREMQEN